MGDHSWLDAAVRVLHDVGEPMHAKSIVAEIERRGLKTNFSGATPHATVASQLYVAIREGDPRVTKAGHGRFRYVAGQPLGSAAADPTPASAIRADDDVRSSRKQDADEPAALTYLDAAERVLQSSRDRRPMHYRDVTREALDRNLIDPQGLTPDATMGAQLVTDIRRRDERGDPPRFTKHGRGLYGLAIWQSKGLIRAIEEHRRDTHRKLLDRVRQLEAAEFEELVALLLANIGVEDVKVVGRSGDGGVDVRGTLVVADVIQRHVSVQAKRWTKGNVGTREVRELRGSIGPHDIGLIITTSAFSTGAHDEARRDDVVPIALMDGRELVDAMIRYGIGVEKRDETVLNLVPLEFGEASGE
jgi:restriction system protein